MKIIADEHISPRIVYAVSEIALRRQWSLESVRGSAYQGRKDEDWVSAFAKGGGNVILSADRRMLRRPTMISKITQLNLIEVFLPSEWAESRRHFQASHILYWWPHIEKCIEESDAGAGWMVPKGLGSGEIRRYVEKRKADRKSATG